MLLSKVCGVFGKQTDGLPSLERNRAAKLKSLVV